MIRTIFRSGTEFLLVSMVVLHFVSENSAKQLMRLHSGLECSMPGYFRDIENCRRFYYCPHPSLREPSGITGEEQQIMNEITLKGMECPDETFFDESVSYCQKYVLANVIPPECKHPSIRQPFHAELKTGLIEDVQSNHH